MDALLILGGLLLIFAGAVWLVVLAFGTSLLWGVGSLLPPVTLVYLVRHWRTARKAVGLSALGFIPLVVGFSLLANHQPERLAAIFSLQWLETGRAAEQPMLAELSGELDGRPFKPRTGHLINGVLTLREGDTLFARQEVNISLGDVPPGALRVDVLPQDPAPTPEIEISWMDHDQELPEARRIRKGYTLHLDLQPTPPNKLAGDFHLVLPAHYQTTLSGRVELYTDELRYQGDRVDLRHDSADTLKHVARDYLQRRFQTRDVEILSMSSVVFPVSAAAVSVQARVNGASERLDLPMRKEASGWAVEGDTYAALPAAEEVPEKAAPAVVAEVETPAPRVDRRQRFSLARLLREPGRYERLQVRAQTRRGNVAQGRFVGIDREGNLNIEYFVRGAGQATYSLVPGDVVRLELLEP